MCELTLLYASEANENVSGDVTPLYDSMMLELSHTVGTEPGTDKSRKHVGGRVATGRTCRQYKVPRIQQFRVPTYYQWIRKSDSGIYNIL